MLNHHSTRREFLMQSSLAALVGGVVPYAVAGQKAEGAFVANVVGAKDSIAIPIDFRLTDRARAVVQLASQEAVRLNHEYIGTEHILLGLIGEGSGVAINVLKNLGVQPREIRTEIERFVRAGRGKASKCNLKVTPKAAEVIEFAVEEARKLNHNYVGTEHILLGLLREQKSLAGLLLTIQFGLTLESARVKALDLLGHGILTEIREKHLKVQRRPDRLIGSYRPASEIGIHYPSPP